MMKPRPFGLARRGAFSIFLVALACAIWAVPLGSGARQDHQVLVHDGFTVTDQTLGDGDNVVEPGESVDLTERIRNIGSSSINTISSYLYSPSYLVSAGASSSYPDIAPGGVGANVTPFRTTISQQAPCGTSFQLQLSINSAQGSFVVPFRIPTGAVGTLTARTSSNVPIPIQSPGTVNSTLDVPDSGLIGDINVRIGELRHTWDEDLRISLIAPDQTRVVLAEFLGGSGDDYINTVFDDDAPTSIRQASPPFTGTFRPQEPLALFGGRQQAGIWKLQIEDVYPADGGTLRAWGSDAGVALCNRAPEARMAYGEIRAKEKVTFESISSDPDGSIVSQAWDLDDDGAFDDGTGVTATWKYTKHGTYTARLRVVDNGGEADVATETIEVGKARAVRRAACVVPRVRGKTLRSARRAIRAARCTVGRVRQARSSRARGRVISQSPKAGARRPAGTRVSLLVSRGRR